MRWPRAALLVAGALWLLLPWSIAAVAVGGWSLTANPTTVAAGVNTVVMERVTDTEGSGHIACIRLTIPAAFTVISVAVTGTTGDTPWAATKSGSGPTLVRVYNPDGGGKLKHHDWVDFRVTVRGGQVGSYTWVGQVTHDTDCTGTFNDPISLPMTIAPAPTPTAPPAVTPGPTAPPRGASASPSEPSTGPTSGPPAASGAAATLGFAATASSAPTSGPDEASASPSASPSQADGPGGEPVGGSQSSDWATGAGSADTAAGAALAFQGLDLLGGQFSWSVPGLVVAVPGLLLLFLVALNLFLGASWVPNVGRLLGPAPPEIRTDEHLWWAAGEPPSL